MTDRLKSPFSNSDLEYLLLLKKHFGVPDSRNILKSLIKEFQYKPVNGVIRSFEFDIMGYYEWFSDITGSNTQTLVLNDNFKNIGNGKLQAIIQNRINSLLKNEIVFSDNIYSIKTIKLEFENRLIDVEEIAIRDFDYILFQSTNNDSETTYYANVYYDGIAAYSITYKLSKDDAHLIINSSPEAIDSIISKYR